MPHKDSEQVAEHLRQAAEAEARAGRTADADSKAANQRIAEAWRNLASGHESQYFAQLRNDAEIILRHTPFLLCRCSSDLRYVFVSEALARMLGGRPEDIVGKKIVEVIGDEAFQTILPHVNAVLSGQHVEYEAEVPYSGIGPRFVHVNYAPDQDSFGQVRGWIASIIDIT